MSMTVIRVTAGLSWGLVWLDWRGWRNKESRRFQTAWRKPSINLNETAAGCVLRGWGWGRGRGLQIALVWLEVLDAGVKSVKMGEECVLEVMDVVPALRLYEKRSAFPYVAAGPVVVLPLLFFCSTSLRNCTIF